MSNSYQYAHDSYYCYESINVLKNKLGICDSKLLEEKERKIAGLSIQMPLKYLTT